MFEQSDTPRVFGVPLGQDFSNSLFEGLWGRFSRMDPTDVARVEILVNTRRMQRHLTSLFHHKTASLLPRIKLVTDIGLSAAQGEIPPAISPLRRRLEVMQLVKGLIDADTSVSAKDAAFDLADSLVTLVGEMQGEGVSPEKIAELNVDDQSGHWQRALSFINLVQRYFDSDERPDAEGRQRLVIETQIAAWHENPPNHPIIVAGSTGSRGTTSLLMQMVSRLPNGAVILPGVDFDMPQHVWDKLEKQSGAEDHPQYRFKALCNALDIAPFDIPKWQAIDPRNPDRTALVSLSLRPAPVTDQWIEDGANLDDIATATDGLSLIEAQTPRAEADAIAACLRQAIDDGKTAALITPDRMLTRQVSAALDRWNITPDDSAGLPLQLTAPGRFLRHLTDAFCAPLTAELLLVLLRHPLTHSNNKARGYHNLRTNALELELRRNGPPFPTTKSLMDWSQAMADRDDGLVDWVNWVCAVLLAQTSTEPRTLVDHVTRHLDIAERLAAGPDATSSGELWKEAAGREAQRIMLDLALHADAGGLISPREYRQLVGSLLSQGEVRDRDSGDPRVLIWGTLEARVQSADLIILGGMNEGTWPEAATPDPWLNRSMRMEAGLLLPERKIGLSAHDYQQAICAQNVVISRSVRSDEAETVPSRWVNRLMNLLGGLEKQGGPECLVAMRGRGQKWLDVAADLAKPEQSIDPAQRPSPRPPVEVRPKKLSVTQIKTLIRDPYAIYARNILRLNALDPLSHSADAPLRGIIVHKVLELFVKANVDLTDETAAIDTLMRLADDVLDEHCPWPATRTIWRAKIARFAPPFIVQEIERRATSVNAGTEMRGELAFPSVDFTLTGTADRIDLTDEGEALIYDYKTGKPPSKNKQLHFDKQLLLEAAMVERGAFKTLGAVRTKAAIYIGLGSDLVNKDAPLEDSPPDETLKRFEGLIAKWMDRKLGYTARRANEKMEFAGNYDHLARFGEWDETKDPIAEDV